MDGNHKASSRVLLDIHTSQQIMNHEQGTAFLVELVFMKQTGLEDDGAFLARAIV